jgi:hypothetical protein
VVYDLENNRVALAPTQFDATAASQVVEIGMGAGAVPGATSIQNPVRATEGLRGPNAKSRAGRLGPGLAGSVVVALGVGMLGP